MPDLLQVSEDIAALGMRIAGQGIDAPHNSDSTYLINTGTKLLHLAIAVRQEAKRQIATGALPDPADKSAPAD